MKKHCRSLGAILKWSAGAAAVLSALSTQAAVLGHSRVTSLPDQPLQIAVQIKDLSPAEINTLTATIAPMAAWQEAGLTAPVDLSSFRLKTVATTHPNGLQLLLESTQVATNSVIDVLVDIKTDVSTQRHQVSVLQAPQPTPVALARAVTQTNQAISKQPRPDSASTSVANLKKHKVKAGQSVSHVARQYRSSQYSDQQFMAALLQANPQAFIHGNLNLIRAGAELIIPDAPQIAAISPQQAGQLYQAHLAWFDDYRQRLAQGQPIKPMSETVNTAALLASAQKTGPVSLDADRLELSAQDAVTAKADQNIALGQELAHDAERLAQLEAPSDLVTPSATATEAALRNAAEGGAQPANALNQNALQPSSGSSVQGSAERGATSNAESTSQTAAAESRSGLWLGLGLLVAVVLAIVAFLRRANTSRLDVVDELSPSAARMRDKLDKNSDNSAPKMDDVEFREIK